MHCLSKTTRVMIGLIAGGVQLGCVIEPASHPVQVNNTVPPAAEVDKPLPSQSTAGAPAKPSGSLPDPP